MTAHRPLMSLLSKSAIGLSALALAVAVIPREPPPGALRLGQKVYVDDASCPAGQVKEVTGSTLTPNGVLYTRKCVSRK